MASAPSKVVGMEIAARDLPLRRLTSLLEIAHSAVSVDSGPTHVAPAVGWPLIVLYGSGSRQVGGRRSACSRPVLEIRGLPAVKAVHEVPPQVVIDSWRQLRVIVRNI